MNNNFINWINNRQGKRIFDFQDQIITKTQESLINNKKTVLAAAPSAGKTLMSIYLIEDYLKKNPTHKVLVLAHGTTVLRTQYYKTVSEDLKPDFTYNKVETFNEYDDRSQVNICLPQTLDGHDLPKIDLLVVDEAHQFYFGKKMVKAIIEKTKPRRELLLTGTPSPFILRKDEFNIIPVPLNTIFDAGIVSDLYVEIATSSYNFDNQDFTQNDELKAVKGNSMNEADTKKTLDDLIGKIVDRLRAIHTKELINFTTWLPALKQLKKTMFVCTSQRQARQVQSYFEGIGVNSVVSISDDDIDSTEIETFVNDDNVLMLIVVGRGVLGFNYEKLVNVVDMSLSRNIDRIYQLLCRVVRVHPDGDKKLFFKVAPNIRSDYYKYVMTAVLSLTEEEFFMKYNGKNFDEMIIPVIKRNNKKINPEPKDNLTKKSNRGKIKPIDFEGLPVFKFFKDLYHKKDALLHVYAYTTVRDVRAEFMKNLPHGYWTKERCIEYAKKYNTPKEWRENDGGAYQVAVKSNFYYECVEHMNYKMNFWTKEKCIEDAKKFKTITEWESNSGGAVSASRRNNWFSECVLHMPSQKPKGYWTKEKCIEDAKKYKKIIEWQKKSASSYNIACKMNWLDECTKHMISPQKPKGYWTKEKCIEDAKKYNSKKEWRINNASAIGAALNNGWYDECTKHMLIKKNKNGFWTKERCINDAKKFTTKGKWSKKSTSAYNSAKKNSWFDECTKHMISPHNPNGFWTKEKCIEEAKKYELVSQWKKNNGASYNKARKMNWIEECTNHMKKL